MNTANAIGFFILGAIMQAVPQITLLGGTGIGAEAQSLWLQVMGVVTGAIGGGFLLREASREASVVLGRVWARRVEAREQLTQATTQRVPLGGVRVTF